MDTMVTTQLMSIEEFANLDAPGRHDLIRGVLQSRAPAGDAHGVIGTAISGLLWSYGRRTGVGQAYSVETGFVLQLDPPTVLVPDVAFVRAERVRPPGQRQGFVPFTPDLAVEVISPSDRRAAVLEKVALFLQAGTRTVWVVEPDARSVTVYTPDDPARMLGESDMLDGGDVLPGLAIPVAEILSN
jgi:Uma2 family endonuclease